MNIPVSDLRKGNLVQTEHGIVPVHHICFNDIYVKAKDGRVLYARDVNGLEAQNITSFGKAIEQIKELEKIFNQVSIPDSGINFVHEVQNWYYWNSGKKELEITI